jgi:anti-sigma factor RsiW
MTSHLSCNKIQPSFSAYLDGAISGQRMQEIALHLETCNRCTREFAALRAMQQSLATLGPAKAPQDLGMKLRLAISHEQAARRSSWTDSFSLKWDNAIRPLLLQVSAGFAGSVALVGGIMLLLGIEALVNDQGRVYDYNIVSGPEDSTVQAQVVDQLLLSVFEPARVFGAPVRGRVVLTFSGISVHG